MIALEDLENVRDLVEKYSIRDALKMLDTMIEEELKVKGAKEQ